MHRAHARSLPAGPSARRGAERIGVVLLNLGTPDGTDYWSMRRYLSEFLSDRRVIDYPPWLWQPLLQLRHPDAGGPAAGPGLRVDLEQGADESPLKTVTRSRRRSWRRGSRPARPGSWSTGRCATAIPAIEEVLERLVTQGCPGCCSWRSIRNMRRPRPPPPTTRRSTRWAPCAGSRRCAPWALPRSPDLYPAAGGQHRAPSGRRLDWRAGPGGDVLPRHAQAPAQERRPLSLPLPEDDAAGARGPGLAGERIMVCFQSRFGAEGWLQALSRRRAWSGCRGGHQAGRRRSRRPSPPTASRRWRRSGRDREIFLHAGGERFTYIPCLNAGEGAYRPARGAGPERAAGLALTGSIGLPPVESDRGRSRKALHRAGAFPYQHHSPLTTDHGATPGTMPWVDRRCPWRGSRWARPVMTPADILGRSLFERRCR